MDESLRELREEIRQCSDCDTTEIDDLSSDEFSTATWLNVCAIHRERVAEAAAPLFDDD